MLVSLQVPTAVAAWIHFEALFVAQDQLLLEAGFIQYPDCHLQAAFTMLSFPDGQKTQT